MTTYTIAEDRAYLEEKAYIFCVREAGHKVLIEQFPDRFEADDGMRYLQKLRLELDEPQKFPDDVLAEILRGAEARQRETGESTEMFWRSSLVPMTAEEIKEQEERREWRKRAPHAGSIARRQIKPREALVTHNGTPFLLESSLNMIWAYRGIGKSIVALQLAKLLAEGGEWLDFKSAGGNMVLLVDGELPAIQIQERIKEFGSPELMRVWSPEFGEFPDFGHDITNELGRCLAVVRPKVIIFDTLTRCFKIDTNDADDLLAFNDGLIRLRQQGYCVILVHHAGKNQTQRGRTDIDDNLDVSVKLDKPYGWQAGDGLAFKWGYEKVRHGGYLQDFQASYDGSTWHLVEDERLAEALEMERAGKSQRSIASALNLDQSNVSRMLKKARTTRLDKLNG